MGPPDSEARLPDGIIVAQWLIYRGTTYAYGVPYGGPFGYFSTYTTPNRYLRLTFASSGKLTAWKYFYK